MADNTTPSADPTVATDDVAGVHYQRMKLVDGTLEGDDGIPGDGNGLHVQPGKGAMTDGSGSIVAGATSEEVFAANAARRYLLIQNVSDTKMWVNFGSAATAAAGSILLPANGGSIVMDSGFVSTESVNIICATTGKGYTAKEA